MTENPARPPRGTAIACMTDVPDPGAICLHYEAGDARFSLILTRAGQRITAWENRCPHARYPMEKLDGSVIVQEGRFLVCAAHGASFRADTGAFVAGPGDGAGLTPVSVAQDGETIRIG